MIKKISIIGSGNVGSTLAFSILNRIPPRELALVDICPGLAQGVAKDLEDTRGILKFSTSIKGSSKYTAIKNSDIVVLTAGIPRKKGMTRADLLKINKEIARLTALEIKSLACNSIVIAVSNPLDVITYTLLKETKFNRNQVFGMGSSLDTNRLLNILYKHSKHPIAEMTGCIYGPHNNQMIVDAQQIKIKNKPIAQVFNKDKIAEIKQKVQYRGAEIVGHLKNRSAHFAPGLSCCSLIEAICNNADKVIPVSVYLNGEYGIFDACLGVPCVVNRKGIERIIELKISAREKKELKKAEKAFKKCMI